MYMSNPLRADIMNRKPRLAWELYLKMETSAESFSLLQLIANDCYKVSPMIANVSRLSDDLGLGCSADLKI